MTWGEFVEACEANGVVNETKICCIDFCSSLTTPEEIVIEVTKDGVLYVIEKEGGKK